MEVLFRIGKPLKRLFGVFAWYTGLKPGANEKDGLAMGSQEQLM